MNKKIIQNLISSVEKWQKRCALFWKKGSLLYTLNQRERYRSLVDDFPDILQRVNLGHIASYLGITQETLSRIRKR